MATVTSLAAARADHAQPDKSAVVERQRALTAAIVLSGKGDRIAFKELYRLSNRMVFGIVLAVIRDRSMAEEITQEVYVALWKRASSFDPVKGNPTSWMGAIARNRAIDRLRAERARGFVTYDDDVPDIAAPGDSAAATVDALAIGQMLQTLNPRHRQALILVYFRGYTHSELAKVLDVPVGTAKAWVRRGLAALKDAME